MIRAVTSRPIRRMRSTMKPESAMTSSSLPSSEGWKRKNGSSIQRFDPRVAVASAEDEQDRADQQPVDGRT